MTQGCLRLLACSALVASSAIAQETPAPGAAPAAAVAASFPWDDIVAEWTERRYKVEALRFKAIDETGWDWLGSDEVMVATFDAHGFTVTNEIGGINSGDTHSFDPAVSCIIAVRPGIVVLGESSVCDEAGVAGPFDFKIEMWEKDGFGLCAVGAPGPDRHGGPHCVNDQVGDDFIGMNDLHFPLSDLETLRAVGDTFTETVPLGGCPQGENACSDASGEYTFTYRITRMLDVQTDFREQLSVAMERSGIGDPGETVAAALRTLPAARDRQAERE